MIKVNKMVKKDNNNNNKNYDSNMKYVCFT